jgi:hypothetical protein
MAQNETRGLSFRKNSKKMARKNLGWVFQIYFNIFSKSNYWKATPLPAHANCGRQKKELAKKNLDRQPRGQKATSPAPIAS